MGQIAAGALSRIALGTGLLALAAVVVTAAGGPALRGAFGSLFGSESGGAAKQTADVRPIATAPATALAVSALLGPTVGARTRLTNRRHHVRRPAAPERRPGAEHTPQPGRPAAPSGPVPAPPVGPPPAPPAEGVVGGAGQSAKEVAHSLPQPVQAPVAGAVDQVVGTVDEACGLLGGCP